MRGIGDSGERSIWLARHVLPHEPALRAWLRRRVGFGFDIDDIIQETYAILATLGSVDHILNPRAYLFKAASSVILMEVRRAKIVPIESIEQAEQLEIESTEPLQDRQLESRQELRLVADAIESLPQRCRQVFVLRKVRGLSQRDIAQELGISESTVEKHVARGIQELMAIFGRGGQGRGGKGARSASGDQELSETDHDKPRNEFRSR